MSQITKKILSVFENSFPKIVTRILQKAIFKQALRWQKLPSYEQTLHRRYGRAELLMIGTCKN